jgi:four helix bundle protein
MAVYVKSFKELEVYKRARELSLTIFTLTKQFPDDEKYSLTSQFRRASRAIGSNIAEAWGKRRYIAHFTSKLTDSDSEQLETQHWVEESLDCEYIDNETANNLNNECERIGKMLNVMIDKADKFCNTK